VAVTPLTVADGAMSVVRDEQLSAQLVMQKAANKPTVPRIVAHRRGFDGSQSTRVSSELFTGVRSDDALGSRVEVLLCAY
jgi:hypothetical protein